ncbi:hypothetical protein KP509_01G080900 [Ceratopteris richardii]|nr:hypothetical protein KP509_01G080900 [Ceratopteris richardii]
MPTGANIRQALRSAIASTSSPNDAVFFHFSGHGTRLPPANARPNAQLSPLDYDECIVPCDMNLITDEDIFEIVESLAEGVRFTIVADCCHSGGLIRYEKEQIGDSFTSQMSWLQRVSCNNSTDKTYEKEESITDRGKKRKETHVGFGRSLPLPALLHIIREKTKAKHTQLSNIRDVLVMNFKDESSAKFRRSMDLFAGICFKKPKQCQDQEICSSTREPSHYLKECDAKTSHVRNHQNLPSKGVLHNNAAILLSACQAYEVAKDITPVSPHKDMKSRSTRCKFGAMSYAIIAVLSQLDPSMKLTNRQLVMQTKSVLLEEGLSQQHPGLYCCDEYVDVPFICN